MITFYDCHLRPIEEKDLEQIRLWRNSNRIRSVMFSDTLITAADQRQWFARIKKNRNIRYFIFEIKGRALGIVNFVDIDRQKSTANWGFYIGAKNAPQGSGKAMGFLALQRGFGKMKLSVINGETFIFNSRGLRFHRYFGFRERNIRHRYTIKNNKKFRVVCFSLKQEHWHLQKESFKNNIFSKEHSLRR